MDEAEILVQSIGLHAVSSIGEANLHALEVTLNAETGDTHICVTLHDESETEILRTTSKLADLQILFLGEVNIQWTFEEAGSRVRTVLASEKQYSYV